MNSKEIYFNHVCCQSCQSYSEGFKLGLTIKEKQHTGKDIINPYIKESLEWFSFENGVIDALFVSLTHKL